VISKTSTVQLSFYVIASGTIGNRHQFFDVIDKRFTVTRIAGARGVSDNLQNFIKHRVIDDALDLDQIDHAIMDRFTRLRSGAANLATETLT